MKNDKLGMKNATIGPRTNPNIRRGQSVGQRVGDAPSMLPDTADVLARKQEASRIEQAAIEQELAETRVAVRDLKRQAADVLAAASVVSRDPAESVSADVPGKLSGQEPRSTTNVEES